MEQRYPIINFENSELTLQEKGLDLRSNKIKILNDSILPEYNDSIQTYNEKARKVLGQFSDGYNATGNYNGLLHGSHPFMLVHLKNSGLIPAGIRLSTRNDLEKVINFFPRGNYTDVGIALRSDKDFYPQNDLLAKTLAEQLKDRGIKIGNGKLISLNALKLTENRDSHYGIVFELNEQMNDKDVLNLDDFRWDDALIDKIIDRQVINFAEERLPYLKPSEVLEISGKRIRKEGLSIVTLSRERTWLSEAYDLDSSTNIGLVFIVDDIISPNSKV
ncbi:MAG: hypothetical protein Q7R52_00430 [archaeon]|nr:hypothetical protein [archaeon]